MLAWGHHRPVERDRLSLPTDKSGGSGFPLALPGSRVPPRHHGPYTTFFGIECLLSQSQTNRSDPLRSSLAKQDSRSFLVLTVPSAEVTPLPMPPGILVQKRPIFKILALNGPTGYPEA